MTKRWHVVRSDPAKETVAAVSVAREGFPVFLPMQPVQRTKGGKRVTVSRPLFPRYLFVRFNPIINDPKDRDPLPHYGIINRCRGVADHGLLCSINFTPLHVPDEIIDAIRDRERVMLAKAGEVTTGYKPGDTFTLQVGRFASLQAAYIGEDKGIVWVSIEILGRGHVVKIPFGDVPPCTRTIGHWCSLT